MRLSTLLLAGVATLAVGSTAFAADLIIEEPTAPIIDIPSSDWTGFYIGVHGGYGAGVMDLSSPGLIDPDDEEQDVDGFLGGIQAGYNWQMDSILFGIQTDISLSGIASDEDGGGENDTIDWLGSTTGRIGFVNDAFVPYLKGGVAYAGGTGDAAGEDDSQTHLGWTVGAGVEFAVTENISVFAEYDYYSFGEETYEFPSIPAEVDVTSDIHTVKAGLNFSF